MCGSRGSKSSLAKAAGAEPSGQMRNEKLHAVVARSAFPSPKCTKHTNVGQLVEVDMWKKCTPLWREARFQVKMCKADQVRTTCGSWDVEEVHAVVARSTFPSQNVQSRPGSDHLWKLTCGKSARRCGAKHISKSKCAKHTRFSPLLDVQMSSGVAGARDCEPCQKWAKREGLVAVSTTATLHYITLHHSTLQLQLQLRLQLQLHYDSTTTLRYTTLHYTSYSALHHSTSTTLHSTSFSYTTLHSTTLQYSNYSYNYKYSYSYSWNCTTLITSHCAALHYTTLHYTQLHYNSTTFHYAAVLHYTTLNCTTLHYTYSYNHNHATLHITPPYITCH